MRNRRLLTAAASFAGIIFLGWFFFGSVGGEEVLIEDPDAGHATAQEHQLPGGAEPSPPSHATDDQGGTVELEDQTQPPFTAGKSGDLVGYSIGAHDLQGLPPDAHPGQRLQMWVSWEPPIVEEPEVHMLIPEVTLTKLIPPVTPEGPVTALLSLKRKHVERLVWGNRYGRLSVVLVEGRT